jgi:hypothetical protein
VRKAAFEVGIYRQIGCRDDLVKVGQRHIARLGRIGAAFRPAKTRTGGGKRLEAETLQ